MVSVESLRLNRGLSARFLGIIEHAELAGIIFMSLELNIFTDYIGSHFVTHTANEVAVIPSLWQVSWLRLTANCFHPASKLTGIQQVFL